VAAKKPRARRPKTQAERAKAVVKQLRDLAPVLRVALRNLEAAVPATGECDDSIGPTEFQMYRHIVCDLENLTEALQVK
jgi:hypothetical protein